MSRETTSAPVLAVAAAVLLLLPRHADAYLDAGTGSYIIQFVVAGLVAALFAIKIFWRKIRGLFSRLFARRTRDDDTKH